MIVLPHYVRSRSLSALQFNALAMLIVWYNVGTGGLFWLFCGLAILNLAGFMLTIDKEGK